MRKFITPRNKSSNNSLLNIVSEAEREQSLRDYKLTIEYKHLKQNAPSGVYLVPSLGDMRLLFGVIFIRRGAFANGIFKFKVNLSARYNDINAWPKVNFTSKVFHPLVNFETGELLIRQAYPRWDPHKHYLVTLVTYVKKIFYMGKFDTNENDSLVANEKALDLLNRDPSMYMKKIGECVRESYNTALVSKEDECTSNFSEEQVCHAALRRVLNEYVDKTPQLTRTKILEIVKGAQNSNDVLYF